MSERARIRTFIESMIRVATFDDDTDLFSSGYVNSLFALELVNFVESTYKVKLDSKDLSFENFRSISAIDALIKRKSVA